MWSYLETAADNVVDPCFPLKCANKLHDIVFRTPLDVSHPAYSGDHLHAWRLWRCGFSQMQGWCGRNLHQNVVAYHEMRQSWRDWHLVVTAIGVEVAWEGLEEAESTWEPVSGVFHDAPAVLRKELKALRLKAEQKRALVQRYGLRL